MDQVRSQMSSDLPPSPCNRGEGWGEGIGATSDGLTKSAEREKSPLPRPLPEYREREVATRLTTGVTWIAAAIVIAAGSMLSLVLNGNDNWMHAFIAASMVSITSAASSMLLIAFGLRDSRLLPSAALGATLIRATVSLGGGVVAVTMFGIAAPPVLLMILGYYLAVLVAECAILFQAFEPLKEF